MPKKVQDPNKELVTQLQILTKQVQNLRDSELVEIFKKPGKFLWFSFLKGLALGLGSALGATILLAFLIYLLALPAEETEPKIFRERTIGLSDCAKSKPVATTVILISPV